jgi:8-oxo-dGTP pyrophosphatase MutT (NUDIX family)
MNFEPQKFFIGLMDFFSILLPGALLTYFVQDTAGPWLFGERWKVDETESAIRFLFSSYLLGHFIFLAGSWIDEVIYDPYRKGTEAGQIERLASGKKLSPRWLRVLATRFFKYDDETLRQVLRIKNRYIEPARRVALNAFQWSKARLTIEKPGTMANVERVEADSKFFRSLAVVLMGLVILGPLIDSRPLVMLAAIGIVPSLWRYAGQRRKAINQAYWYVMTIEAALGTPKEAGTPSSARAGGVVFRKRMGVTEYLLVESSREPRDWVLPKGHIEPNESARQTAVREVREESGVWARIVGDLDSISYESGGEAVTVQFYLMEALEEGKPQESRKHEWFSPNALPKDLRAETRTLLIQTHRV